MNTRERSKIDEKTFCKAVFNLKKAASYLGISVPTLVRLLKSGEIPCRRGGQRWLIAQSVLDDWLKQKS